MLPPARTLNSTPTQADPDHFPAIATESQTCGLELVDIPMVDGAGAPSNDKDREAETATSSSEGWMGDSTFACTTESDVELFSDVGEGEDFGDMDSEDDPN